MIEEKKKIYLPSEILIPYTPTNRIPDSQSCTEINKPCKVYSLKILDREYIIYASWNEIIHSWRMLSIGQEWIYTNKICDFPTFLKVEGLSFKDLNGNQPILIADCREDHGNCPVHKNCTKEKFTLVHGLKKDQIKQQDADNGCIVCQQVLYELEVHIEQGKEWECPICKTKHKIGRRFLIPNLCILKK